MVTTESGIIAIEVLAAQGPVGTRGGVEWMRGPGACPRWGATCLLHAVPKGSRCHQDKHKAQYISLKDLLTSLRSKRIKQVNKIKKLILRLKWLRWRHIALLRFILVVDLLDLPAVDT